MKKKGKIMTTDASIMIQALWLGNPKEFDKIVGFQVETFYESGEYTILWEKPAILGRTKKIKTEELLKLCFTKIKEIQNDNKIISFESFYRLSSSILDMKLNLEALFFETARSANADHGEIMYEHLVEEFVKNISSAKNTDEIKQIIGETYRKLIADNSIISERITMCEPPDPVNSFNNHERKSSPFKARKFTK